jgi:hypothetical protein
MMEGSRDPTAKTQFIQTGTKICAETVPGMGLGNRMKCLLSVMRICQLSGATFGLLWSKDRSVPCGFEDLFDMPVEKLDAPVGDVVYRTWRLWVAPDEIPAGWARAYPSDDVQGRAIDLEYERIPQNVRAAYLPHFMRLQPRTEIVRRAQQSVSGHFVAVHVRDGNDWSAWGRGVPLENFFTAMDHRPPQTRFFVSAHTPRTVQMICDRYPGRISHQADKVYAGDIPRRMQDALTDLLCLAGGTELIGTFGSTFSEMAWWFGGCRQKVEILRGDMGSFKV